MNTFLKTGLLAIATLACLHCGGADATGDEGQSQDALINNGGLGADGDDCSIDRGGLKIPGSKKGTKCCNIFDDKDCVDLPAPAPTATSRRLLAVPPVSGTRLAAP